LATLAASADVYREHVGKALHRNMDHITEMDFKQQAACIKQQAASWHYTGVKMII